MLHTYVLVDASAAHVASDADVKDDGAMVHWLAIATIVMLWVGSIDWKTPAVFLHQVVTTKSAVSTTVVEYGTAAVLTCVVDEHIKMGETLGGAAGVVAPPTGRRRLASAIANRNSKDNSMLR